ncbi:MAG: LacI family DNA-binding transcriptional regulator [Petrimonas sp.]|nr:LacI family DNA-binding transcriptional regulator [Petrimonas sp.]MEA5080324.1 LacI family DNA-binding transcriptional regulator [Dysgonamonadaceae bacterium]
MLHKSNIVDIAEKSGFSITTVSRVLNGKADKYRISKTTQQKIKTTAKELNYVPNEFAQNLRTGKSKTIALIVPSLKNPFFAEIASVINLEARKSDFITLIGDSNDSITIEKEEVKQLSSRSIGGMIIVPCGKEYNHLLNLKEKGLPIVCIDRYFVDQDICYVSSDNYNGAYSATKYLIEQGHTNIACIQGLKDSVPNIERVKGFKDALNDNGISSYSVTGDAFSEQNGYLETKLLLHNDQKPSAIFAFSNTIAMGVIKALKEENILIPDEISLITFDDNPYLDYIEPPLTRISQPIEEICKIAVKILISKIQDDDTTPKKVLLKTNLIIKDSVKSLKSN